MERLIPPPGRRPDRRPRSLLRAAFCDGPHRNAAVEKPQPLAGDSPSKMRRSPLMPPPVVSIEAENREFSQRFAPPSAARNPPLQTFAVFGTASAFQGWCRAAPTARQTHS